MPARHEMPAAALFLSSAVLVFVACSSAQGPSSNASPDAADGADGSADATTDAAPEGSTSGNDGSGTDGAGGGRDGRAPHADGASESGAPGALVPGTTTLMFNVAGQARTVLLHVPAQVTQGPVPLVLALHGDGDQAQNFVTTI